MIAATFAQSAGAGQPLAGQLSWPVTAPRFTQDYACKGCCPTCTLCPGCFHTGVDLTDATVSACSASGPLVLSAATAGTVVRTQRGCGNPPSCSHGFGNHVIVEHTNPLSGEHFFLIYAHLLRPDDGLHAGDSVFRGDPFHVETAIGSMGDTGWGYDGHLDFGVLTEGPLERGAFVIG